MRGVNQRTATAIALMAVLLFSIGTFIVPAQSGAHNCCSHQSVPSSSSKQSCCTAAPQIPPVVITSAAPQVVSLEASQVFLPAMFHPVSHETSNLIVQPPQSPHSGTFALRI